MSRSVSSLSLLALALVFSSLSRRANGEIPTDNDAAADRPNVVFILADDLGWAELGCYGNTFNETPHLDRLAREGMRLTNAYAAAPVCSPYRAALLTGQYPAGVGIVDYLRPADEPLSIDHVTIAEVLKRAGYATGMIGKWHLTGYRYHGAKVEIRPTASRRDCFARSRASATGPTSSRTCIGLNRFRG